MNINKLFPPIAAAFALVFAFLASPQVHAATYQSCTDEYNESDASSECIGGSTHFNMYVDSNDNCNVADSCPKNDGTYRRTNYSGPEDDMDDLVVCNGVLKKDSCP